MLLALQSRPSALGRSRPHAQVVHRPFQCAHATVSIPPAQQGDEQQEEGDGEEERSGRRGDPEDVVPRPINKIRDVNDREDDR